MSDELGGGDAANDNVEVGEAANDNTPPDAAAEGVGGEGPNDGAEETAPEPASGDVEVAEAANDNVEVTESANDNVEAAEAANDNVEVGEPSNDSVEVGETDGENADTAAGEEDTGGEADEVDGERTDETGAEPATDGGPGDADAPTAAEPGEGVAEAGEAGEATDATSDDLDVGGGAPNVGEQEPAGGGADGADGEQSEGVVDAGEAGEGTDATSADLEAGGEAPNLPAAGYAGETTAAEAEDGGAVSPGSPTGPDPLQADTDGPPPENGGGTSGPPPDPSGGDDSKEGFDDTWKRVDEIMAPFLQMGENHSDVLGGWGTADAQRLDPADQWKPEDGTPVLGRTDSLEVKEGKLIGAEWAALNLPPEKWSPTANREWVQSIIDQNETVRLGEWVGRSSLWNQERGEPTVYAFELRQLFAAGYGRRGDYMVPPGKET